MELVMTLLILVLVAMCAARWGADSRPIDADRPTRWWPATPRDWPGGTVRNGTRRSILTGPIHRMRHRRKSTLTQHPGDA